MVLLASFPLPGVFDVLKGFITCNPSAQKPTEKYFKGNVCSKQTSKLVETEEANESLICCYCEELRNTESGTFGLTAHGGSLKFPLPPGETTSSAAIGRKYCQRSRCCPQARPPTARGQKRTALPSRTWGEKRKLRQPHLAASTRRC